MPHDLATANRHDHAWTENWAPNIWMLCTTLSPMRPWYAHRRSDRRDHLYGTEGTWINCPTCFPLLNVGFMAILRRTDCFILIWTCIAVLAVSRHCHFQNCPSFKTKPEQKQERSFVLLPCCASKTMPVKLHGRSHPAHNAARMAYHTDHRPCGCRGIKELEGPSRGHGLKGLDVKGY